MTTLMNSRTYSGLVLAYTHAFLAPANGIYLCVGAMPSDAQVDAMTVNSDALITNNKSVTYSGIPFLQVKPKDANPPLLMFSAALPNPFTVNATRAGTLGWAVLMSTTGQFSIVDVGLPNSGSVVQVDVVNVSIGTPVTFMGLSYKMGR